MTLSRSIGLKRTAFKTVARKEAAAVAKIRLRKCAVKECRQPFEPRSMTHRACGEECAAIVAKLKREAAEREDIQARKVAMKGLREWIADTQVAFNAVIRARDANQFCISCPTHLSTLAGASGGGFDCGHYRSRGSAPHLRFDERNAHGQCKQCNRYKSGNAADYRVGLIARIGLQTVEALEAESGMRKWSIEELKGIKALYRAKLKALKDAAK